MNKELKTKWVAALRSGAYKQGRGQLLDSEGKFCCLGVLREVMNPGSTESMNNEGLMPSILLAAAAGMPLYAQDRRLPAELAPCLADLSHLNDAGHTFHEIADWIEANL